MPSEKLFETTTGGYSHRKRPINERLVVEWYEDSPRFYVRHEKNDPNQWDGWRTVNAWEVAPGEGVVRTQGAR